MNDPAFKLPKKSREVFYYLPLRMLDIFPTVAVFSEIDLRSGNVVKKPLFYQAKRFKDTPTDLILGNNIVLNKKSGVMKLGSQQVPLNSFIVVSLNKDGKTNMVPQMPTAPQNTKNYFLVDPVFWADNGTELGEKWEAMKAGL